MEIFQRTLNTMPQKMSKLFVEGQISTLETKIRYAEIIDSDAVAKDEVAIGKQLLFTKLEQQIKIPIIL